MGDATQENLYALKDLGTKPAQQFENIHDEFIKFLI
jgi:hypothetical protein